MFVYVPVLANVQAMKAVTVGCLMGSKKGGLPPVLGLSMYHSGHVRFSTVWLLPSLFCNYHCGHVCSCCFTQTRLQQVGLGDVTPETTTASQSIARVNEG